MHYWAVYCMEDSWPGLWRKWETLQVATVGWPAPHWNMEGTGAGGREWSAVRKRLKLMGPGDGIVARLPRHRIGRVGHIMELKVTNEEWDPVVPKAPDMPMGQHGRRILVRWDFSIGPQLREYACTLPEHCRLSSGESRKTINELDQQRFGLFEDALRDEGNWTPAFASKFRYERALSDFIATFPERLQSDLRPYPMAKVRENAVVNRKRLDLLLIDDRQNPVVVECKQGSAAVGHLRQIREYMKAVQGITGKEPRGILVFGGSPNVPQNVIDVANQDPKVDLFAYLLDVTFTPCAKQ